MEAAKTWNDKVRPYLPPFGGFLQSYEWGELQEKLGFKVVRVFEESTKGTVVAQCIEQPMPFGQKYYLVPKGPLGSAPQGVMAGILQSILTGAAFLKIEPNFRPKKAVEAHERHPSATTIVRLDRDFELILEAMKPKTRYNIRLAEKKHVTIRIAGLEAFDEFIGLMQDTAARDKFSLHTGDRYKSMLSVLSGGECKAYLAFADYEGKALAVNLMIDSFGTRTYLHGASSSSDRNIMAPYALHTHLMRDAAEKGLTAYDFWGIAPPGSPEDHPWAGISRFKLGFGGEIITMPGTFDVPMNNLWYQAYKLGRRVRHLM